MQNVTSVELTRDCEAVQIPAGHPVTLPAGTPVDITQTLGGTYTVRALGGLFRIAGKEANQEELEKLVWETLKTCYDPEIPVNIVDLGLIYDLQVEPLPGGHHRVGVKMTLTAPGCGMGTVIASDAQQKLLFLPSVEVADVEIVWDPPWHQSMITSEGRKILELE